jgi:hypothetical protein
MIGRVSKLEKDISYLENFIDNYEFVSGKEDLYNYSFVENFDNDKDSSEAEGSDIPYVDRDGNMPKDMYMSGGFIDSINSKFKIGSNLEKINMIGLIKSYSIKTNYDQYVSSSSNPTDLFDDKQSKSWSVSVKSPRILTGLPIDIEKYVDYDFSLIIGAKSILEIELRKPVSIDSISISPNFGLGLSLMQVAIEKAELVNSTSNASSSGYILEKTLNQVVDLSKSVIVNFERSKVRRIIFVFNQDTYTRTEHTVDESELVSRKLHEIIMSLRSAKKKDHNIFQDLVLSYFRRRISIDENKRNNYLHTEYYTYKYPISSRSKVGSSYEQLFESSSNKEEISNYSPLSRMVESIVGHVLGSRFNALSTTMYRESISNQNAGRLSTMANNAYLSEYNSNIKNKFTLKDADPIIPGASFGLGNSSTSLQEKVNTYNYNFSIQSISLFSTLFTVGQDYSSSNKAIFISKKIPVPGKVLGIKAKVNLDQIETSLNKDLKKSNSYELSFSVKETPNQEIDWIPIIPFDSSKVESEVVFFNAQTKTAYLRFYPRLSNIVLYEDGFIVSPNKFSINPSSKSITMTSYDVNKTYVIEYDFDDLRYSQKYIDTTAINPEVPLITTSSGVNGEYFTSTGLGNIIKIQNTPYVDYQKFINPVYSETYGTISSGGASIYNPVQIRLMNGTYAVNLTNYISGDFTKASFYETDQYLFYQNGKNIVFNKPVNSPFNVIYSYINNNIRFRLISRNNYSGSFSPGSVDNVIVKMKINNSDNFANKMLGIN